MAVDIKQAGAVFFLTDHMGLPQLFVQRFSSHDGSLKNSRNMMRPDGEPLNSGRPTHVESTLETNLSERLIPEQDYCLY
jgi:hypothetical protein